MIGDVRERGLKIGGEGGLSKYNIGSFYMLSILIMQIISTSYSQHSLRFLHACHV